jgi:alkyl hydroperoxide reductase subunit AhpC
VKYLTKKRKSASERARQRANRRWQLERERRDRFAAADPMLRANQIVRRIIVIDREQTVREAVIYGFECARDARRKLKSVLAAMPTKGDEAK